VVVDGHQADLSRIGEGVRTAIARIRAAGRERLERGTVIVAPVGM